MSKAPASLALADESAGRARNGATGERIAPPWHTAALVALVLAVAAAGAFLHIAPHARPTTHAPPFLAAVGPLVVVELGLAAYVCRGRVANLAELVGATWHSLRRARGDLALAAVVFATIELGEAALAPRAPVAPTAPSAYARDAALAILPRTPGEALLWIGVAAIVAFSEELVYRGYLQTQFTAWTRRAGLATVLQAALFGSAHLEQGAPAAARFAGYAVILGILARTRGSLVPGMLGHFAVDATSGLAHVVW
jgi:membrane protease YdiL (CAAX protease family)